MEIVKLDGFTVTGLAIRTSNTAESDPTAAKIGELWQRFGTELMPQLSTNSKVLGVYTNYESDFRGKYDVYAAATELTTNHQDVQSLNIEQGNYLVFTKSGEMPQAVIKAWQEVWAYFDEENCPYQRSYTTDYEWYKADTEVQVLIAIQ